MSSLADPNRHDPAVARARAHARGRGWRRRLAVTLGSLAALVTLALAFGFVVFVARLDRFESGPGRRADAVVVLTGGAERIAEGVRLLREGSGRRLLISGVNERTTRVDVAARGAPADQEAFFSCCVDLGYRARNTIGNALEARRWALAQGFRSLVVVTSSYHMPRTLAEFAHAMPELSITPYPVITERVDPDHWWLDPATLRLLASEYVKYLVASVRIRVEARPGSLMPPEWNEAPHARVAGRR